MISLQPLGDADAGAFAVGRGVDDFPPAVHAVASGEVFSVLRLPGLAVDHHAALSPLYTPAASEKVPQPRLANCGNHHVACQVKNGSIGALAFDALHRLGTMNPLDLRPPMEHDPVELGDFILVLNRQARRDRVPLVDAGQADS